MKKVHKYHCRELTENLPQNIHFEKWCKTCQDDSFFDSQSQNLGCKLIRYKPNNVPVIGCPGESKKFHLPFKVGESSGLFTSETERGISLMQSIIEKICLSGYAASKECSEEILNIRNYLKWTRTSLWMTSLVGPRPPEFRRIYYEMVSTVNKSIKKIDTKLADLGITEKFPWIWFNLKILHYFVSYQPDCNKNELSHLKKNEPILKIIMDEISSGHKILSKDRILEIIISQSGESSKKCNGKCRKEIIPQKVAAEDEYLENANNKIPCCILGAGTIHFVCGNVQCFADSLSNNFRKLTDFTNPNLYNGRCDYCWLACKKLHRCSKCKTKQYCGQECLEKDWELIHKELCQKGDIERKKKGGTDKRHEERRQRYNSIWEDQ